MNEVSKDSYQVLARKYRPASFADLIGQDAMVRILKNAFSADRVAHAFMLTGIRGTGKTTTARIIAKGMNCIGPDGNGGPTTEPCGQCKPCQGIAAGRFFDVLEIDAASATGVDNIRELNAMATTRPAEGRYKIFIIDEVHMLSTAAFNALLKTLEEPPAHVKFIMATTDIQKVPVTVLSRCQRFDLRRIEPEVMIAHLESVASQEGARIAEDALALITRAAEGSVRDAMSLMDQAISHGAGETTAAQVRDMLGLADRGRVLDLFDLIMTGDAGGALRELSAQYADGADPLAVLRDLAEITHWVSIVKITPDAVEDPTIGPDERLRGQHMAEHLPMRAMTRMWQLLLKALEEVATAPNAMMAAEMAIIRLTHMADLPSPEELVRKLQNAPMPGPAPTSPGGSGRSGVTTARAIQQAAQTPPPVTGATALAQDPDHALARFSRFEQVVELIRQHRDVKLLIDVETTLQLASYSPGRIAFVPTPAAPTDLAAKLGARLQQWTGNRWAVSVVNEGGAPTIAAVRDAEMLALKEDVTRHPMMQAVLHAFPNATITDVKPRAALVQEAAFEALPEIEDEWDPFEDG